MSKKVLIVGHGSGITTARINGHLAEVRERGVEIIEVETEYTDLSGSILQPIDFVFSRIPDIPNQKIRSKYKRKLKFR